MSGQELVDELDGWDADAVHQHAVSAVDTMQRAKARIEAQEKALKDCADNADKAVDELLARTERAEQKSAELAAVIAEALRIVARDRIASANLDAAELADILISVPVDVLSAYTTRIREEAVEWEYAYAHVTDHDLGTSEYMDISASANLYGPGYGPLARRRAAGPWSEIPEGQADER